MGFNDGDKPIGAVAVQLLIDIAKDGIFSEMCTTSFSESLNLSTETIFESCGGGASTTIVTGKDEEFPFEAIVTVGGTIQKVMALKYAKITELQNIPVQIRDLINNKQSEIKVALSSLEITYNPNETVKVKGSFKPFSNERTTTDIVAGK